MAEQQRHRQQQQRAQHAPPHPSRPPQLCYNDLQGELQRRVLEHLAAEGRAVSAGFAALAPGGPPGAVLKLLSDVDDTVFSSGGSFPAGSDTRYPK